MNENINIETNQYLELDYIVMNLTDPKDFTAKKQEINKKLKELWYVVESIVMGDSALLVVMGHILNK